VLLGAFIGTCWGTLAFSHLIEIEAFGTYEETALLVMLLSATIGALGVAIAQAYRVNLLTVFYYYLFFFPPFLVLGGLLNTDWAQVRAWGWVTGLVVLAALLTLFPLERLVAIGARPRLVAFCLLGIAGVLAMFLGPLGLTISAAVFVGQIGQWSGGQLGLEFGQMVGGLLAIPLAVLIIRLCWHDWDKRLSMPNWAVTMRDWVGAFAVAALANGAMLWLLLADGAHGVEVRQVRSSLAIKDAVGDIALSPQRPQFQSDNLLGDPLPSDMARYRELGLLGVPVRSFTCAVLSTDGRRLLSGGKDGSVRLWDLASGRELCRCEGHRNQVTSVNFSPDGRRALSGSKDWTARLWDLESGRQVRVYRGHAGWVMSVAFSADGRTALSGGGDGTVRVWLVPQ
jgi:hypothetical protein